MAKKWTFMKANGVYIYPSANADDGGDVNSEVNVSGITQHLIQKNFIIPDKAGAYAPLQVILENSGTKFSVYKGSVILAGYYIDLSSKVSNFVISGQSIDTTFFNAEEFFSEFNSLRDKYDIKDNKVVLKNKFLKSAESIPPLPTLHLVLKLVKNVTGNLRGDLLERLTTGSNILMNRACAWSILTSAELELLDVPYIDIAQFIPAKMFAPYTGTLTIQEVINPNDRSSYIDINSIFDEDGNVLSDIIDNRIKEGTQSLPAITYYTYDAEDADHTGPRTKTLQISVEDGIPRVIRYSKVSPVQFDDNGDYIVEKVPETEPGSYSIDAIQHRTHVASYTNPTTDEQREVNRIAKLVDNKDNGSGTYSLPTVDGYAGNVTNNGTSRLLAHADHTHDGRYLLTLTNSSNITQTVNTNVEFKKNIKANTLDVNSKLTVNTDGDISNPVLTTQSSKTTDTTVANDCAVKVIGSLNVSGYISANRVYNAVWNDYAELYKKLCPKADYEEGTVICKIPEVDAYGESNYKDRRLVVGVVTERYGHLLGGDPNLSLEENLELYIPVAVSGRVPVRVVGHVNEGDLLVVSTCNGYATSEPYPEPGTVIGKALESTDGTKDKILMQVMLG